MECIKSIITVLFVSVFLLSPVSALSTSQNAIGMIVGDDNHQLVTNDNTQQTADINLKNGDHNIIIALNDNSDGKTTNNVATQYFDSSSSSVFNILNQDNPDYYGLNIGLITTQIVSLYKGQALVAYNDNDQGIPQKTGDVFEYTIQSSLPVLAYVVNANEANRAEFDIDVAPVYDQYAHKFDVGNLDTIFVSKYRSPQQQFVVTIPEDGRYALVIDTRVSQALDGRTVKITDDSVDVVYSINKTHSGSPNEYIKPIIGVRSYFPILSNGMADTEF